MPTRTRWEILILLCIVVVLAGCTAIPELPDVSDDSENGEEDETMTDVNGVSVTGPTCIVDNTPCADVQVTEFSVPEMAVSVENTGDTPATVALNDDALHGREVLTSKCSEYRIQEFRAEVVTGSSVRDAASQGSVVIDPGEELEATWFVELRPGVDPGDTSLSCVFRFQALLSQQLTTVKQVQVRGSETVDRLQGLPYDTTGQTPVELVVDTEDSVVQELIGGEVRPFQAQSYLVNRGTGDIVDAAYRNGPERIHLTASGLDRDCSDRQIDIMQGEERVQTAGILCRIIPGQVDGSQLYDIKAETTYDYRYTLEPIELAVGTLEADQ